MNTLFVCDIKTGDFLWNEKRIPMPKMEENLTLTSSDEGIAKQNTIDNNDDDDNNTNAMNNHFEAVSTQESNNNYFSGSQPSSQNNNNNFDNNNNNWSPVQRKLNFNDGTDDGCEEKQEDLEETNENDMNIIHERADNAGDQSEMDPVQDLPTKGNNIFGFGAQNDHEGAVEEAEEKLPEEATNVLNMSLDNIGEPSLQSPLFRSKKLKRKRNLNESTDDFESPIKRIKTTNEKEDESNPDELGFPNLASTPTKKTSSPKKQRNVRSPSLALLEEEDELDDIIYNNETEESGEKEGPENNQKNVPTFKQEPEEHFTDAYETFHFDENILAVSLAEAP